MKNKKLAGMLAALAATAALLGACVAAPSTPAPAENTPAQSEQSAAQEAQPAVVGGWTVNDQIVTKLLPDDSEAIFQKAMEGYVGVGYEPAALLATQVVAGTNYLYLCKGTTVTAQPVTSWYLVTVYNDLEGNAQITQAQELDLAALKTTQTAPESGLAGGWSLVPVSNAVTLPQDVWAAFNKATENFDGPTLNPIALLATQVVNGTNNLVFCQGQTADGAQALYVATLYINSDGSAEISDVQMLDMFAYLP